MKRSIQPSTSASVAPSAGRASSPAASSAGARRSRLRSSGCGRAEVSGAAGAGGPGALIVRGQARLLADVNEIARLNAIRGLFERLEAKETMLRLLDLAQRAEGVQIFIGAGSGLFDTAGCSVVVAPYKDSRERVVGAIGVIGPTRINYGRIIPAVDYTARVIGRMLG